jgi:RNA binding exosome subunit
MAKVDIDTLVDLAFAVEEGDPIDWGLFKNGQEQSMKMIAASIIEQFDKEEYTADDRLIIMSTITKLVVENFILHARLKKQEQDNEV